MTAAGASEERKLAFLRETGTGAIRHVRISLFDHLVATRNLLASWDAPAAWCDAALFHAIYGTKELGLPAARSPVAQDERERVRALIGDEAERLAWLFGRLRPRRFVDWLLAGASGSPPLRRRTPAQVLAPAELRGLANLLVANALEQVGRRRYGHRRRTRELIRLEPWLLPGAIASLRRERSWRGRLRRRRAGVPARGSR